MGGCSFGASAANNEIERKSAPAIVMRVTTRDRNSAVGRPGRIPGMKPPYRLMLSATSFGTNVNAV